jgi:hypothetical protein
MAPVIIVNPNAATGGVHQLPGAGKGSRRGSVEALSRVVTEADSIVNSRRTSIDVGSDAGSVMVKDGKVFHRRRSQDAHRESDENLDAFTATQGFSESGEAVQFNLPRPSSQGIDRRGSLGDPKRRDSLGLDRRGSFNGPDRRGSFSQRRCSLGLSDDRRGSFNARNPGGLLSVQETSMSRRGSCILELPTVEDNEEEVDEDAENTPTGQIWAPSPAPSGQMWAPSPAPSWQMHGAGQWAPIEAPSNEISRRPSDLWMNSTNTSRRPSVSVEGMNVTSVDALTSHAGGSVTDLFMTQERARSWKALPIQPLATAFRESRYPNT